MLLNDAISMTDGKLSNQTESGMNSNIQYVNNTGADISYLFPFFAEAYKTGVLHEDIADLFAITILKGYNSDGTDRMLIEAA